MFEQENECDTSSIRIAVLERDFSADQVDRLIALRQQYLNDPIYSAIGLDARRLLFARWLVQSGYLSEDC
ncbi:MAG: hypothetical protein OJF49_002416 [Ktedonobacterales bacterium]|jgi:hypothetical protein|nr:MAG: hypothetical protein OJF49_002416 [Ktedonobacterales bacterium]